MNEFSYQHSKTFTENEYIDLESLERERSPKKIVKRIIYVIICTALLFSKYTISFGILGFALLLFLLYVPVFAKKQIRKQFKESAHLQHELKYGLDQNGFWLEGPKIQLKHEWAELKVWKEKNGILILSVANNPKFYFPIEDLKKKWRL